MAINFVDISENEEEEEEEEGIRERREKKSIQADLAQIRNA